MENVREYISLLSKWGLKFLKDTPQDTDAIVDFKLGSDVNSDDVTQLSISNIVDIEENIICPSLGLKGMLIFVFLYCSSSLSAIMRCRQALAQLQARFHCQCFVEFMLSKYWFRS